ncbi:hypothetical protein EBZ39_08125 [bacterium]|nr:hypothetical protein [bacterium]
MTKNTLEQPIRFIYLAAGILVFSAVGPLSAASCRERQILPRVHDAQAREVTVRVFDDESIAQAAGELVTAKERQAQQLASLLLYASDSITFNQQVARKGLGDALYFLRSKLISLYESFGIAEKHLKDRREVEKQLAIAVMVEYESRKHGPRVGRSFKTKV